MTCQFMGVVGLWLNSAKCLMSKFGCSLVEGMSLGLKFFITGVWVGEGSVDFL